MATTLSTLRNEVRRKLEDLDQQNYLWEDSEIDAAINHAIRALWPDVYKRRVQVLGTTSKTSFSYPLPTGVERIGRVDVEDTDGHYIECLEWEEEQADFGTSTGNNLWLRRKPRDDGKSIRITYRGKFAALVNDQDAPDYPPYCEQAVIVGACATCVDDLVSERSKFSKFAAKLDKEAATIEDLIRVVEQRYDRFNAILDNCRMAPIDSQRQRQRGMTEGVQPAHSGRSRLRVAEVPREVT